MNRDELGQAVHKAFCDVLCEQREWDDLSESEKEDGRKIAERFLAAAQEYPRTFHARVSLMGHRTLGLCRVTEAPLAGVTMLRCEVDGAVEWVNPAAVYSIAEVPDDVAAREIATLAEAIAQAEQRAAERRAALRGARALATVDVVVDRERALTALRASLPGLFGRDDDALTRAMEREGLGTWSTLSDDNGRTIGLVVDGSHVDALTRVAKSLGFTMGAVRAAEGDELDADIPF